MWKGRDERYESKVQSILHRKLNVKVRNTGFTQQAMENDSEKNNLNVIGLEHSFNTLDLLESP